MRGNADDAMGPGGARDPGCRDWVLTTLIRLGVAPVLACFADAEGIRSGCVATADGIREIDPDESDALEPFFEWAGGERPISVGPVAVGGIRFPDGALAVPIRSRAGRILGCLAGGGDAEEGLLRQFADHLGRHFEESRLLRRMRRFEKQLEVAKRDWERTFNSIRDEILVLDDDGIVVRANRAMKERLGRDWAEIVGRPVAGLLGESGAERIRRALGKGHDGESIGISGLEGRFEISAWVRRDADGGPDGSVVALVDVTEKERLRAQLLHAEKLSELGELISGIAHELNNPLTAVLGYAQVLELKAEGMFGKELRHLKEESLRASRIVKNLLTFARRGDDRREVRTLDQVVRQTLSLREYDLRVRDIRVETSLAPEMPGTLMDPTQLQQVVLNLINNAEYAIRTASDSGRLWIATEVVGDRVRLVIQDDGPGVPERIRAQVFHPFFTTKPVGRGTGLGLSICYGIVRDHDGEIRLESPEEGGARFVVELPCIPDAKGTMPAPPEVASEPERRSRRVLLVDDEPAIRSLGREFLETLGHRVVVAEDGEDALARFGDEAFDAVVCDLRMPKMDGREFYRRAVARDVRYRDRFVFMSGDSGNFGREFGSAPLIAKPFDLDDLSNALDNLSRPA